MTTNNHNRLLDTALAILVMSSVVVISAEVAYNAFNLGFNLYTANMPQYINKQATEAYNASYYTTTPVPIGQLISDTYEKSVNPAMPSWLVSGVDN